MITIYEKRRKGLYPSNSLYPSNNLYPIDSFIININEYMHNGLGTLRDFISNPKITEILNGDYYLEFEYSFNGFLSEELDEERIIKANNQLFRIYYVDKNLKKIKVLAKHIAFDLNNNFVEDTAIVEKNGQDALNWIFSHTKTKHSFTGSSDILTTKNARYVRKNIFEVLYTADNSILNIFGGDFEFDNLNVILHEHRGSDNGLFIRHGKNLTGIEVKYDFSNVATKIMPQGKDGLLLPEKYVNSSLLYSYHAPIIRKVDFDIGIDEDTDELEAYDLLRLGVQNLFDKGLDKPRISVKVDFIDLSKTEQYKIYSDLETVSLGDTVTVYVEKLNIVVKLRVVKTEYDLLKKRFVKLELGEIVQNTATSTIKNERIIGGKVDNRSIISSINQSEEKISILAEKLSLEGYTTINEGFSVDLDGNMTCNNGKFTGDIFLSEGKKIVGSDGLLTNLQFNSIGKYANFDLLGYSAISDGTENGFIYNYIDVSIDVEIPENFTILDAYIELQHTAIKWTDNQNVEYWGASKNLKLYKTITNDTNYMFNMAYMSEYTLQLDSSNLIEIVNAFGSSSYTPDNQESNNIVSKKTIDLKEFINESGKHKFVIRTTSATPTSQNDTGYKTGMGKASMIILGYIKI